MRALSILAAPILELARETIKPEQRDEDSHNGTEDVDCAVPVWLDAVEGGLERPVLEGVSRWES